MLRESIKQHVSKVQKVKKVSKLKDVTIFNVDHKAKGLIACLRKKSQMDIELVHPLYLLSLET